MEKNMTILTQNSGLFHGPILGTFIKVQKWENNLTETSPEMWKGRNHNLT